MRIPSSRIIRRTIGVGFFRTECRQSNLSNQTACAHWPCRRPHGTWLLRSQGSPIAPARHLRSEQVVEFAMPIKALDSAATRNPPWPSLGSALANFRRVLNSELPFLWNGIVLRGSSSELLRSRQSRCSLLWIIRLRDLNSEVAKSRTEDCAIPSVFLSLHLLLPKLAR